jgi:hypothetical protein
MPQSFDRPPYADPSPSNAYSLWPISFVELTGLIDLGLSNDQIAKYFGVGKEKVSALRAYYGLAEYGPEVGGIRYQTAVWHQRDNSEEASYSYSVEAMTYKFDLGKGTLPKDACYAAWDTLAATLLASTWPNLDEAKAREWAKMLLDALTCDGLKVVWERS